MAANFHRLWIELRGRLRDSRNKKLATDYIVELMDSMELGEADDREAK